ncbi:hypothetical protein FOXYSP1_08110 [Fusarium oxysporum f. sp. phaseoli]
MQSSPSTLGLDRPRSRRLSAPTTTSPRSPASLSYRHTQYVSQATASHRSICSPTTPGLRESRGICCYDTGAHQGHGGWNTSATILAPLPPAATLLRSSATRSPAIVHGRAYVLEQRPRRKPSLTIRLIPIPVLSFDPIRSGTLDLHPLAKISASGGFASGRTGIHQQNCFHSARTD